MTAKFLHVLVLLLGCFKFSLELKKVEQDSIGSAFLMTPDVFLTGELFDDKDRQGALVLFRGEDETFGTKFIVYLEFTSHQVIIHVKSRDGKEVQITFPCQPQLKEKDIRITLHFKDLLKSPNQILMYINCKLVGNETSSVPIREGLVGSQRQQINPRFWFYVGKDVRPVLQNQGCPVIFPTQEPPSRNAHETIVRVVVPPRPKPDQHLDKERTSSKDRSDHVKTPREPLPESRHRLTLPDSKAIPIDSGEVHLLSTSLRTLTSAVRQLQRQITIQGQETRYLREVLSRCDMCRGRTGQPTDTYSRERIFTCQDKPCFDNVPCEDTSRGYRCGRCPANFIGDGITCVPKITCEQEPCYAGVPCTETVDGVKCGQCPAGVIGDESRNGCQEGQITCESRPCFPGVACVETTYGYECGDCPNGMQGNGTADGCVRSPEGCESLPCFDGVLCNDIDDGYQCGPCPPGTTGNGTKSGCHPIGCDSNPCFAGVECVDSPNGYQCSSCPEGYKGNGTHCTDIDECRVHNPCSFLTECVNLIPGYKCTNCPIGYSGSEVSGVGIEGLKSVQQLCEDVNECEDGNNGGCVDYSHCTNTPGSFVCGECFDDYTGNQTVGCREMKTFCPDGVKECHKHAMCIMGTSGYDCQCRIGYAGNGEYCAKDNDLDGMPNIGLRCKEYRCSRDNCRDVPNSGQEDVDLDGIGDACDEDIDGDGIVNNPDNCPYVANPGQENTDEGERDNQGDSCDNCPSVPNTDQVDTDKDGIGDACDPDIDNDGILNENDNCPKVVNPDQDDGDEDGVGDLCDNCPFLANKLQNDSDHDSIGDICDTNEDEDSDGIQDNYDNCEFVPNADQLDTDEDNIGNVCDEDDDNDGIDDDDDNCPLVSNPDQTDTDGDGFGDACVDDTDGDGYADVEDVCPEHKDIHSTDFRSFQTILLDPVGDSQIDPEWLILNQGAEIVQTKNSDPGLAVSNTTFSGVDFSGTFFVNTEVDDDYAGFIFSFQDNSKFYCIMWKKSAQTYWHPTPFRAVAEPGIQLKLVNSKTGPGEYLRNALWHTGDTADEVQLLWKDPRNTGWKEKTAYRLELIHRPNIGLIRILLFEETSLMADSGNVYDATLRGGKLGVFSFSQEGVIWSDLVYRCNDYVPRGLLREGAEPLEPAEGFLEDSGIYQFVKKR
ncbi:cartilage oligomeric matrix protein-like isoform X2 [Saccostrea echinata]|uniref:cartilage oligomeric matrix protein-like isoform X2 n=1 Tax=Saccostrea echinata TaxID=191078 RepID=UPI002A7F764F|nr:cartilage oligomeric matrix protein-like isoform X2 [Saccostrea echinata]